MILMIWLAHLLLNYNEYVRGSKQINLFAVFIFVLLSVIGLSCYITSKLNNVQCVLHLLSVPPGGECVMTHLE